MQQVSRLLTLVIYTNVHAGGDHFQIALLHRQLLKAKKKMLTNCKIHELADELPVQLTDELTDTTVNDVHGRQTGAIPL
jgi:hypothetical protein